MFNLEFYQELSGLPGVFFVTADNECYGSKVKGTRAILTNCPWLSYLSRDKPPSGKSAQEAHWLTSGGDAFASVRVQRAAELDLRWARLFKEYLEGRTNYCPYCAHTEGLNALAPQTKAERKHVDQVKARKTRPKKERGLGKYLADQGCTGL